MDEKTRMQQAERDAVYFRSKEEQRMRYTEEADACFRAKEEQRMRYTEEAALSSKKYNLRFELSDRL